MKYLSTHGNCPPTSFRDALFHGLAIDGGLYVPENIPRLPTDFFEKSHTLSLSSIGADIASAFCNEISPQEIDLIVKNAWGFEVPLVQLKPGVFLLELFHGPTLAFKDLGARFMAQTMSHFLKLEQNRALILVATSGDTGSAVAHGFFNAPNITICVLYPSGRISPLQEQQMATLGGNIRALEIQGTFDDCQHIVKRALGDESIRQRFPLTTANSINIGRLIPQVTYYHWAAAQLNILTDSNTNPLIVVPSGNFGNLTAGVYAQQMGAPIRGFVAATNSNDVVPAYFSSGQFIPRPSVQTYSCAMDVGNPGNFARLQTLYRGDLQQMQKDITAVSVTDAETLEEIRRTYESTGYVLDPHTAVGVAAVRRLNVAPPVIVTATAHPAKFPEVILKAIGIDVPLPLTLQHVLRRPKLSTPLPADYHAVRDYLLGNL